jgi:hypothetical protein
MVTSHRDERGFEGRRGRVTGKIDFDRRGTTV